MEESEPPKSKTILSKVDEIFDKFKDILKHVRFLASRKRKKLLIQYGDHIRTAIEKIEQNQSLGKFLKENLGSYFPKISGAWDQYESKETGKTELISSGVIILGKKFIDIFIHESRDVLRIRKGKVYVTLNSIFIVLFSLCLVYFLILMPVDVSENPEGNFILPGNEKEEWAFAVIMALIVVLFCGYIASVLLSKLSLKMYVQLVRENQKLGLVPTAQIFGGPLYRKLLSRAVVGGFLAYNMSMALVSQLSVVRFLRSPNPEEIRLIPDPELMVQLMWIVAIPAIILLVPIWLMMDIGLVKTKKPEGYEFESVNIAGSKIYKYIKGYAGIAFVYNLILVTAIWATDDVPFIRILMRLLSPFIVISYMFPVVVIIDYKNEVFKKKLWNKLQKYKITKKIDVNIREKPIESYKDF